VAAVSCPSLAVPAQRRARNFLRWAARYSLIIQQVLNSLSENLWK
jgi:hypothetical protein